MRYCFGDCTMDINRYELRRAGVLIRIEPKVFEALTYLLHHRERFVSRDELIEKLWPGVVVGDAALTQCVAKARKAVGDDSEKQHIIRTQHGRGYRFVAEVRECDERPTVAPKQREISPPSFFVREEAQRNEGFFIQSRVFALASGGALILLGFLLAFGLMTILQPTAPPLSSLTETRLEERMTSEVSAAKRKPEALWFLSANSPEASAYYLHGWDSFSRFTPETNDLARQLFARAIAMDPRYIAAYVGLGWTYVVEWDLCWTQDADDLEQALDIAQKALALNESSPAAYLLLSRVYLLKKHYEQAINAAESAVALNPDCADCYATLADLLAVTGRPRQAIELVEQARALDAVSASDYAAILGQGYFLLGQPELAIPALRRALIRNPNLLLARLHLALAYSELGLEKAAKATLLKGQQFNSSLSLDHVRERLPHQNPGQRERLLIRLQKVGLQ